MRLGLIRDPRTDYDKYLIYIAPRDSVFNELFELSIGAFCNTELRHYVCYECLGEGMFCYSNYLITDYPASINLGSGPIYANKKLLREEIGRLIDLVSVLDEKQMDEIERLAKKKAVLMLNRMVKLLSVEDIDKEAYGVLRQAGISEDELPATGRFQDLCIHRDTVEAIREACKQGKIPKEWVPVFCVF